MVEIQRWVDDKIGIQREEPLNLIFHDEDDGQPRFVESIWPLKSYPFLYGSIPQTWESPNFDHTFTGFLGDNNPVDFFDMKDSIAEFVDNFEDVCPAFKCFLLLRMLTNIAGRRISPRHDPRLGGMVY